MGFGATLPVAMLLFAVVAVGCTSKQADTPPPPPPSDAMAAPTGESPMQSLASYKINLNTATKEDFLKIPGVGDRMVREFMEYRPYSSILQFRREMGKYVDEATIAGYEEHVFVPVDPNSSDDATIMQLPGVDESVIEEFDQVKPFVSKDQFLETLAEFVTREQYDEAASYLVEE